MTYPKTRRAVTVALLFALLTSLGINACLASASFHYVKAATALRLDPAGLGVYAADRPKSAAAAGPVVVFFGDSRALMWSGPTVPNGYRVVNRGVGFQTTAQILLRFEADVAPLHPSVVVLEAGVNDLKAIAEFPERRAEIVADCEANLERIVDRCRQAGASVVLVTVFGIGDVPLWRRPFWSSDVAASVREVNAFLPRLAREKVVLLDADPVLVDGRGAIQRDYQLDYIHLSSSGYAALNRKLAPLLSALPR